MTAPMLCAYDYAYMHLQTSLVIRHEVRLPITNLIEFITQRIISSYPRGKIESKSHWICSLRGFPFSLVSADGVLNQAFAIVSRKAGY